MDWLEWLVRLVAVASLALNLWQYRKDIYRLNVNVRYVPEASSYIIETRNIGRRPISVVSAGVGGVPSIWKDHNVYVWSADEVFPQRIDEGDAKYFGVWWGDDVSDRDQAHYVWVRDARGKSYSTALPPVTTLAPSPESPAIGIKRQQDLNPEQLATKLYNLEVEREQLRKLQKRLAYVDAQVDYYETAARLRQKNKANTKD